MRTIRPASKHSVFIAHCDEDHHEAEQYKSLLAVSGFSVASHADSRSEIENAHFFILLVSDKSLASDRIQRELGLARARQRATGGYLPIVIQVFAREAAWRKLRTVPSFPVRDFETGKRTEFLPLNPTFDELTRPQARNALIAFMRPTLSVARGDILDVTGFNETEVSKLYADLFPPNERVDPEDIEHWVLDTDLGTVRSFNLSARGKISYQLDSRYFILSVANKAIGLGFLTYDYDAKLAYVNYIGVQRCWRDGQLANALFHDIIDVLADLFPEYEALILEVERFDIDAVDATIERLKTEPACFSSEQQEEIRKFLRIRFYHKLGFFFFVDTATGKPLVCRSPCVDPSDDPAVWKDEEADYWIMRCDRQPTAPRPADAAANWRRAIQSIYVEILLKSVAERRVIARQAEIAEKYWEYGHRVVDGTIASIQGKRIELRQFPHQTWYDRWRGLNIVLPI
ncbi:toll/interleukin-1 receptor domain-containing protein [Bradyrhizobium sp. USDA 4452]